MRVETDLLMESKAKTNKQTNKAKARPPDKIFLKTQKGALYWRSRPLVFIRVNRVEMLVLLLPHVRRRELLAWDGILDLLF
jgi:hypothetical protein